MTDGWLRESMRVTEGQPMLAVSVTQLPPELEKRKSAKRALPGAFRGEPGFAGREAAEPEFAIGSVTGYRWWALPAPDPLDSPDYPDTVWAWDLLRGMHDTWDSGLNEAQCLSNLTGGAPPHKPGTIPDDDCSCGFWGYWEMQPRHSMGGSLLPVLGVIEGSGKTLIGETGFRCAKAKIRALHLPDCGLSPNWHAAAETRLQNLYPEATLYRVLGAMTREYPPDPNYSGQ
jgi:hypothetical protein